MAQLSDPYRALGVSQAATDAEIKAAHRKLVKRYHPDTGSKADTQRFLHVQEAYRVLSDPLLRREWDARHSPGPLRADRAPRPPRPRRAAGTTAEPSDTPPPPRGTARERERDRRSEPRSSRAYTWSAAEVPWWEDAGRRKSRARKPSAEEAAAEPPGTGRTFAEAQDFDVYNRSSGAAWSMAARAYFRKGDQDLPRRGSWHVQGSQPLTAARARTAAQQEARRRAAAATAASAAGVAAAPSATAAPAQAPASAPPRAAPAAASPRVATAVRLREWPSLGQRLGFALVAWLPIAALVALTSASSNQLVGSAILALSLALLFAVPRLAYVAGVATLGLLAVGALFIGGLAIAGVGLPLSFGLTAAVGGALALGYIATAGVVILGPASLRPWSGR